MLYRNELPYHYNNERAQANQYLNFLLWEDMATFTYSDPRNEVNRIWRIFRTRRRDVLRLIENFGVPRRVTRAITKRIIRFVLQNKDKVSGGLQRKVQVLFTRFIATNPGILLILNVFGVPPRVSRQFIRRVIRVTLRNADRKNPNHRQNNLQAEADEILQELEESFPQITDLANTFNVPIEEVRDIARRIILFTLENLDQVPEFGPTSLRAQQMYMLLQQQEPELLRKIVELGVPVFIVDDIARTIIIFVLERNG